MGVIYSIFVEEDVEKRLKIQETELSREWSSQHQDLTTQLQEIIGQMDFLRRQNRDLTRQKQDLTHQNQNWENQIQTLVYQNQSLVKQVQEMAEQMRGMAEQVQDLQKKVAALEKDKSSQQKAAAPKEAPSIASFSLDRPQEPLVKDRADIDSFLKCVTDTHVLEDFLQQSTFSEKDVFQRLLNSYHKRLQIWTDKLPKKLADLDDEEVSESVTTGFFSVLTKGLLDTLPIAIYRGAARNPEFYQSFLNAFNQYLQHCGVYTWPLRSQTHFDEHDLDYLTISRLDTPDKTKDNCVAEIEQLPYCLDYLDDDGERQFCLRPGRLSLWKYQGESV